MNAPEKMPVQQQTLNLFQRINEVRKAIDYIKKDKSVSTGASGSYKAVTHDQVTAMVREHMVKFGIVCYPELIASASMPKEGDAKQFRYEATYSFHFVNVDDSADRITVTIQAHAMDNADKAPGKALSYAKKYAVLKLFEIETGEDEESRYQSGEVFDLLTWTEKIDTAPDKSVVQYLYLEAKKDAMRLNDAPAFKTIGAHVKKVLETKFQETAK